MGDVTVIHGDALATLRAAPDGAFAAVITDPPYSARTHKNHDSVTRRTAGDAGYDGARRKALGYAPWHEIDVWRYVPELCRVSSGWVVVMTDHTLAPAVARAMEQCGRYVFAPLPFYLPGSRVRLSGDGPSSWTDWIIVGRTTAQHRWGTLPGGYTGSGAEWRDKVHMGGKPTGLMRALVRDYSRPGDLILDPFAGSGTTGVAARLEGRRATLIESDAGHVETIRARLATPQPVS